MAIGAGDDGAAAAAPLPVPVRRAIAIHNRKRKGAPTPTLEDVRNAAGVGGTAAQPGPNAPDAKRAPDRAWDISRDLRSRPRWISGIDEFEAVRILRPPPADGEAPVFPIPSPLGTPEEPLAPPAAGATVLDLPLTDSTAPTGNAYSAPRSDGTEATRRPEPPKAPPLEPPAPGTDLYGECGIVCHLVRTTTVPTGDPGTRAGRSRLFPSAFDASIMTFEMIAEPNATPARGWGPMITIESARSAGTEVIHGLSVEFVMRDYPILAPDRVAIHRAGARLDAAGTLFVEFPTGTGLQMATFLHTFVHLPGALPARVRPDSEALAAPPRNASEGGGISLEFYGVDYTYVRSAGRGSGPRRPQSQAIDGLVHVVNGIGVRTRVRIRLGQGRGE